MQDLVERLTFLLATKKMKLVTAESCTGGLLSATITHRPGASDVFERGFVTYSNEAKVELLNVHDTTLEKHGAVSSEIAEEMAVGALKTSHADLAISITGIAGPEGGSEDKPIGLVYFGFALKKKSSGSIEEHFKGSREKIQTAATMTALKHLISILEE